MCDGIYDPPEDRRKNKTCIECRKRKCDHAEDEICRVCWDASIAEANMARRSRIAAGWLVDSTGGIHPPNASDQR